MTSTLLAFFLSFLSVVGAILFLRPLATDVGLVDRPCSRKQHVGEIPLVGGLGIYTAVVICSFVVTPFDQHYKMYLLSTSFMVLIGALDDFYDINAGLRLIAQFLIGSLMVFGAGIHIESLGALFSDEPIMLGLVGPLFTVLAAVTCINAFNMTDGVDGLVGTLSLSTILAIGVLAMMSDLSFDNNITSMLAGAVVAFLFFNTGKFKQGRYKVFMGDAGSMLMGLTIIWLLVYTTQGEHAIMRPATALWLIAIPLMDMFSVMVRRIMRGDSPLKASRDHLHHILMRKGMSAGQTTLLIGVCSFILCAFGVLTEILAVRPLLAATLFVAAFLIYNLILSSSERS